MLTRTSRHRPLATGRVLLAIAVAALASSAALAASLPVSWDPDSSPDTAGYRLYWGTSAGNYTNNVDAGMVTSYTLTGLNNCTRYYTAVKAYDAAGNLSVNYSNEVSGLPTPVVSTIAPASAEQGQTLVVTITGSNLDTGAVAQFSDPSIVVNSTTYQSCTQITASISVPLNAATGADNVDVTNPDRSYGRLAAGLQILAFQAPTVATTNPADGATNIATSVHPAVTFSEPMLASSISSSTVQLLGPGGTPVAQAPGSPGVNTTGTVATITPASALGNSTNYRIQVVGGSSGVKDLAGNAMTATYTQATGFTTSSAGDAAPPSSVANLAAASPAVAPQLHATLTWTAPNDNVGAVSYQIRQKNGSAPASCTDGTAVSYGLNGSGLLTSAPTAPLAPGSAETFTIVGLKPNSTYFFAICSKDAAGNQSGLSNVVSIATPKYEGYGYQSTGGGEQPFCEVSNLNDSGPGSLRSCAVPNSYVVFSVAGTIVLQSRLNFNTGLQTYDGATAPSPGVTVTHSVAAQATNDDFFRIQSGSHYIFTHLRLQGNWDWTCASGDGNDDNFSTAQASTPIQHLVLDHITSRNAGDSSMDLYRQVQDATFSFNYLLFNVHPVTTGSTAPSNRISIHHNLWAKNGERQPQQSGNRVDQDERNDIHYIWSYNPNGISSCPLTYDSNGDGTPDSAGPNGFGWSRGTYATRLRNTTPGDVTANIVNNWFYDNGPNKNAAIVYGSSEGCDAEEGTCSGCSPQVNNGAASVCSTTSMGALYVAGNQFETVPPDSYSTVASERPCNAAGPGCAVTTGTPASLATTLLPVVGTQYRTADEQALVNEVSSAMGSGTDTTPPTVSSTSPADGATNVSTSVHPTVTFSEPMLASSISSTTVKLLGPGGTPIAQAAGSPALNTTGTVATITPASALGYSTSYKIQVVGGSSGVKDLAGNAMASTYTQATGFTTGSAPDTTPPTVSSTSPADGATNVSTSVHPTVTFSEPMLASSMSSSTVKLLGPGGTPIAQAAGSPVLNTTGTVATITPASALGYSTSYKIQVVGGSSGVKDLAGNAMASTYTQATGFTTGSAPDTTPPTVSSTSPTDGTTNVAVSVQPSVTFSEPMLASSISSSTVKLLGPGGTAIAQAAGSPALDASGTVATITPASALGYSTTYKIQAVGGASGVKDLAGNAMASTSTQATGFTTGSAPDTTPPTVSSTSPADGATNVSTSVHPTVTFSEPLLASSISSSTVKLLGPGGTAIAQAAGSPALDASGTVATITPAGALGYSTTYKIQAVGGASGVKDLAGNAMASTSTQATGFTTGSAPDTTPPAVSSTSPADGATNVSTSVHPTVTFNEPMLASSITSSTVRLLGPGGNAVGQAAGSPVLDASGTVATITPVSALGYSTSYTIQAVGGPSGVKDLAGNSLASTYTQPTGFTTAAPPDTTPPSVYSTNPADGTTNVTLSVQPSVTFSEPMLASSISPTTVNLLGPGGTPIAQAAGSPVLDASGTVATITPASALGYSTSYKIQAVGGSSGVKDLAGNAMASTYTQATGFTTPAAPDTTPPTVSSTNPADGATNVATSVYPTVTFSEPMLASSIGTSTVNLLGPGGTAIAQAAGSPVLDASGTVATITPASALGASTSYKIQVVGGSSGVKDLSGNAMTSTNTQATGFTTAAAADTTPPTVGSTSPADGATNVAASVHPTVTFSERMDPASITTATVRVLAPGAIGVTQAAGSPVLDASGTVATIVPAANLGYDVTYQIQVIGGASGVKDSAGNAMQSPYQQNNGFRTGSAPDSVAPYVQNMTPQNTGINIQVNVHPTITFSEAMDPASITPGTVQLIRPDGTAVPQAPGSPALDATGVTATITPAFSLGFGVTYRLQAIGGATGVKDLAHNSMTSTWTETPGFTTKTGPPGQTSNLRRTDKKR